MDFDIPTNLKTRFEMGISPEFDAIKEKGRNECGPCSLGFSWLFSQLIDL